MTHVNFVVMGLEAFRHLVPLGVLVDLLRTSAAGEDARPVSTQVGSEVPLLDLLNP